jgi:heme/copper-type cytochrome/quinol oxidase subunit 2
MKKINVSGGSSKKANRKRAAIGYSSLVIASLIIYFLGVWVVNLYGFEPKTKIRDVDSYKALLVFITMIPIVGLVIWGTLSVINQIFNKLNI